MLISTKEWILIRYFLSMSQYAQFWLKSFNLFKKWKWQYQEVNRVDVNGGNSSIYCIFDEKESKLSPYLDDAYKAANPNQFEEKTLLKRIRKWI
jgi:hypothetical protein